MEKIPKPKGLAEHYDEAYRNNPAMFGGGKPEPFVLEAADMIPPDGVVIELGAGQGRNAIALAEKGFTVTASDISKVGVETMNKKAQEIGLSNFHAIVRDNRKNLEGEADMIVSTFMLHHLSREEAETLIAEIKKHTKPGGINAIITFTADGDFAKSPDAASRFYPASGEMREKYYSDWKVIKYAEERREAKAIRPDGSSMFNVGAKIIARKPVLSHKK